MKKLLSVYAKLVIIQLEWEVQIFCHKAAAATQPILEADKITGSVFCEKVPLDLCFLCMIPLFSDDKGVF